MLILPLKTSNRYCIKDDIGKWLDNNNSISNGDSTINKTTDDFRVATTTTTTSNTAMSAPPPSYDMVLQNHLKRLTMTSSIQQHCYTRELQRLQSVRNCIIDSISNKSNSHSVAIKENALRDCYEYHAILLQFEQHGFISSSSSDTTTASSLSKQPPPLVTITWKGAYNNNESETHTTLLWDRVCIMYNIVALLSYQIHDNYAVSKLSSSSCMDRNVYKNAIRDCQLCASILSILREVCTSISKSCSDTPFFTIDLSSQLLSFWEKLFIAEAQHYIYRMASVNVTINFSVLSTNIEDKETIGRQHRTYAVLCQSMYDLYNDALLVTKDPRLVSEIYDHIQCYGYYTKILSILSLGRANYHQSIVYHMNHEYGNEIAALRNCQIQFQQCIDFIHQESSNSSNKKDKKKVTKDSTHSDTIINMIDTSYMLRECQTLLSIVNDTIHTIDDMNLRIYHNVIPKSIPNIPSQQLAKINPILPNDMIVPQIPLFVNISD